MRMRKNNQLIVVALAMLALMQLIGVNHVSAQTTSLAFSPDPASIFLNVSNSVAMDLVITGGVMVNAFDVELSYDPTVAQLTNWAYGTYLKELSCFFYINRPGYFKLACVQQAQPGANGAGILLSFSFTGKGFGSTPLTFTYARLSNTNAQSTYPATDNGLINTLYLPGTIKNSSLSGTISLQGQIQRGNVPVKLEQGQFVGQGPFVLNSTNTISSNLTKNPLPMDAYLITTSQPRYLNLSAASNKVKGILATPTKLSNLTLLAGDLDGDAQIGVLDLAMVASTFGQTGNPLAGDVNFDGTVNTRDLSLVAGNFGKTSATAYAGWLP